MIFSNPTKEKMKAHDYLIDGNLRFGNPMFAEIMIKSGISQVCIDNEHFQIGRAHV